MSNTTAYPGILSGAYTYDFHNPFMSASIVTPTGTYALWTSGQNNQTFNIDTNDPGLGNLKALSFLTELTVENNIGNAPVITATLNPPMADGLRFLETTLVEYGTTCLEVTFGYASGTTTSGQPGSVLTNPLQGLIGKAPDITLGPDCTIVLKAIGVGCYGAYFTQAGQVYPDTMTTMDIINLIGQRNFFTPVFQNLSADPDSQMWLSMPPKQGGYAQGGQTDWMLLQDLLRITGCFGVITQTASTSGTGGPPQGTMVIQPRSVIAAQQSAITLAFFSFPTGNVLGTTVFPILSMSTPTTAIWAPGVRAAIIQDIDALKKQPVQTPIVNSTQPTVTGSTNALQAQVTPAAGDTVGDPNMAAPNPSTNVALMPRPGDPGDMSAVQQAKVAFGDAKWAMGIHLQVETIGCPTLYPGMNVNVSGCGLRLNGNYCIYTVTHVLGAAGYTTQLHLIQNAGQIVSSALAAMNSGPVGSGQPGSSDNSNSTSVPAQPG